MRILIFIADISRTGGTERATTNLANILCKYHSVKIISLSHSDQSFFPLDSRVEISSLGIGDIPLSIPKKIIWYFNFLFRIKKVIKIEKPDCIIGEGHNISALLPLVSKGTIKTIACEHIDFETIPTFSKTLMKFCYPKLDRVVVLSEMAKNKIKELNNRIEIIPNSLPFVTDKVSNVQHKRIIMVGRISQEKGYERLVPIAKKMLLDFLDWKIDIFGDGDLKDKIKSLYVDNALTNVEIKQPTKDIKEEYLKSSMLLITSYNEAMPMVILEANHCGLPVIGFDNEGTKSLINNGKTGFVVEKEEGFYEKLKSLILDENLRMKMSSNAREESEKYSMKNVEEQWIRLLNNL